MIEEIHIEDTDDGYWDAKWFLMGGRNKGGGTTAGNCYESGIMMHVGAAWSITYGQCTQRGKGSG